MKKLIIAEKPSLAINIVRAIGNLKKCDGYYEGKEYIVTFAYGHLLQLFDIDDYKKGEKTSWNLEELPFCPETFKYKLPNDKGIIRQYKIIEKLIKNPDVSEIINCGDADREGEVIINNIIYEIFSKNKIDKKIKRLWLPEQTESTILKSLKNLKDIYETKNLYEEGLARSQIDWLYGINLTRYISILAGDTFPVGRVIIPALKFIYDRDKEINDFIPKKYLEITSKLDNEIPLNFNLKYELSEIEKAKEDIQILKDCKKYVSKIDVEDKILNPQKLFSLDSLQNYMFKNKKFSLDKTLKIVQSLYEKGLVTYPRTNTEYLADEEKDKVKQILSMLDYTDLDFKDSKKIFDSSKVESHSAIIITSKQSCSLSEDENFVYNVIKNRFISNFVKEDTVISETNIEIMASNFKANLKGKMVKKLGFLKYENIMNESVLPTLKENDVLDIVFNLEEKETKPPVNVTEAELNKFFKNPFKKEEKENDDEEYKEILNGAEIGTVATRAETISKIKRIGYVTEEKNHLMITDKGKKLINALMDNNIDLFKEKTVEFSKNLKKIFKEEITKGDLIEIVKKEITSFINKDVKIEKSESNKFDMCPICNNSIVSLPRSYSCLGYKDNSCNFTIWKEIAGKKINDNIAKDLIRNKITKKITGFKSKTGNSFDAKLKINEITKKVEFEFDKG